MRFELDLGVEGDVASILRHYRAAPNTPASGKSLPELDGRQTTMYCIDGGGGGQF